MKEEIGFEKIAKMTVNHHQNIFKMTVTYNKDDRDW